MKVCVSMVGYQLEGYNNIQLTPQSYNFDQYCDSAELLELVAEDILEYFPLHETLNILRYFVSKIRHGGKLIVSGRDGYVIAKTLSNRDMNIQDANLALYGNPQLPIKSFISLNILSDLVSQLGLKVIHKRIDGVRALITTERV